VTLATLLQAGYLEEGETLHPARKQVNATAVLLGDGRLEAGDRAFETPSAAATAVAGTVAENGWQFWLVLRGDGLITLADVRTQFTSAARGAGLSADRLELARLVVATREPEGSTPDALRVPWADVATKIQEQTGERLTGAQMRRLFYQGGGKRVDER
jgi:hypothetical protein